MRLIELPLNAELDESRRVERTCRLGTTAVQLERGILSQADQNVLYIDEVNLSTSRSSTQFWMRPHRGSSRCGAVRWRPLIDRGWF